MIITVAGNKKEYKDGLTVAELIEAEKGGTFDKAVLKDGDSVEFLYFMGGGC